MESSFYICALVAILSALRVIMHTNPVHALLYLIILLLSISGVFFTLGAHFAAALEIIIYAGAILVLFVFIIMMLNLGGSEIEQEREWLKPKIWIGPTILSIILLVVITYPILGINDKNINYVLMGVKAVGIALFREPYILAVELVSMLLIGSLVVVFHLGRREHIKKILSQHKNSNEQKEGGGHI